MSLTQYQYPPVVVPKLPRGEDVSELAASIRKNKNNGSFKAAAVYNTKNDVDGNKMFELRLLYTAQVSEMSSVLDMIKRTFASLNDMKKQDRLDADERVKYGQWKIDLEKQFEKLKESQDLKRVIEESSTNGQSRLEALVISNAKLRADILNLKADVEQLNQSTSNQTSMHKSFEKEQQELNNELMQKNKVLTELEESVKSIKFAIDAKGRANDIAKQTIEMSIELIELNNKAKHLANEHLGKNPIKVAEEKIKVLQQEFINTKNDIQNALNDLTELDHKMTTLQKDKEQQQAEILELRTQSKSKHSDLTAVQQEIEALLDDNKAIQIELDISKEKQQQIQVQLKKLTENKATLNAALTESKNAILALEQKEQELQNEERMLNDKNTQEAQKYNDEIKTREVRIKDLNDRLVELRNKVLDKSLADKINDLVRLENQEKCEAKALEFITNLETEYKSKFSEVEAQLGTCNVESESLKKELDQLKKKEQVLLEEQRTMYKTIDEVKVTQDVLNILMNQYKQLISEIDVMVKEKAALNDKLTDIGVARESIVQQNIDELFALLECRQNLEIIQNRDAKDQFFADNLVQNDEWLSWKDARDYNKHKTQCSNAKSYVQSKTRP